MYRPIYKQSKAICLSWDLLSNAIAEEVENILDHDIDGHANMDAEDYWAFKFAGQGIPFREFALICEDLRVSEDDIAKHLPPVAERGPCVRDLSMEICNLLLLRRLGYQWEYQYLNEESFWVLGDVTEVAHNE